ARYGVHLASKGVACVRCRCTASCSSSPQNAPDLHCDMPPRDQVGRQVRRGISWNLAGAVATNAIRIVVLAVLGRVLTPTDFGVVAAAVSDNVIFFAIRDIGIGRALIQRQQLDDGHLTTTFAVSTYLGLALAALLIGSAPLIGRLFQIPASV